MTPIFVTPSLSLLCKHLSELLLSGARYNIHGRSYTNLPTNLSLAPHTPVSIPQAARKKGCIDTLKANDSTQDTGF